MELPKPEWIKLIPADGILVFCFSADLLDVDMERVRYDLKRFFGERKILAVRTGDVEIYAIADRPASQDNQCICGGEPHASHCPANPDPFLRGLL